MNKQEKEATKRNFWILWGKKWRGKRSLKNNPCMEPRMIKDIPKWEGEY